MKYILLLLATLLLSYSSFWTSNYVSLFQDINIIGNLEDFKEPCTKTKEHSHCTDQYRIPYSTFKESKHIGIGVVISATKYYCLNADSNTGGFDNILNPGKRFDIMNTYQTIDLGTLNCKADLVVEAWSRLGSIRKGYQEGALVAGDYNGVTRVKVLNEFFAKEIHRIFCFIFLLVSLSFLILNKILQKGLSKNPFIQYTAWWILFLLAASDLFQTLIPYTATPQLFNKIIAILSVVAHTMPIIYAIGWSKLQKKGFEALIVGGVSIALFSPFWLSFFHLFFMGAGIVSLSLGIKRKEMFLIAYGVITVLVDLKIQNFPHMPSAMATSIFIGLALCKELMTELKVLVSLASTILNVKVFSSNKNHSATTKQIEENFIKVLNANRVSFLRITDGGGCLIHAYEKEKEGFKLREIELNSLPPVFAYVIANDSALKHQRSDSSLIQQIKVKDNAKLSYNGDYLSIHPIKTNGDVLGAVAFTDYPSNLVQSKEKNEAIELYLDALSPIYCEKINSQNLHFEQEFNLKLKNLKDRFSTFLNSHSGKQVDKEAFFKYILDILTKEFDAHGYIGELDSETKLLKVWACQGYTTEIGNRILNGKIYAHEENKHGPIPLSIHERKPIIVPDVSILKGVLHEYTNYFFKVLGTKSCLALPITTINTSRLPWGVVFLESKTLKEFNTTKKKYYFEVCKLLHEMTEKFMEQQNHKKTTETLKKFIPEANITDVMEKKNFEVKDRGYLLMIDLKSSTVLANKFGREAWEKAASRIKDDMEKLTKNTHVKLQDFKWDALYFTLSTPEQTYELLFDIQTFLANSIEIINQVYSESFGQIPDFLNPNTAKGRFCLVYGDISRGVVGAKTKTWTFKGEEMANVTKLEDQCKTIQKENPFAVFFCDDSIETNEEWTNSQSRVDSNQRKIFYFDQSWGEMATKFNKVKKPFAA